MNTYTGIMKKNLCFSEIIEGLIVRRSTVVIASNIESLDESAMSGLNVSIKLLINIFRKLYLISFFLVCFLIY